MTDERMAPLELVERDADGGLVREVPAFAAERLMERKVEAAAGAAKSRSLPRTRSGVSQLRAEIDERVGAFLERPIEGRWPCLRLDLRLDATDLKVREDGRIVSRAVMAAVAVNEDGRREVLGVAQGPSEAEVCRSACNEDPVGGVIGVRSGPP